MLKNWLKYDWVRLVQKQKYCDQRETHVVSDPVDYINKAGSGLKNRRFSKWKLMEFLITLYSAYWQIWHRLQKFKQ